jgi:hypothetical protein
MFKEYEEFKEFKEFRAERIKNSGKDGHFPGEDSTQLRLA